MKSTLYMIIALVLVGCGGSSATRVVAPAAEVSAEDSQYLIGPGDLLRVYVWNHPDLTVEVPVRPDGLVTTPLVEDMRAVGKTPFQLARDVEVVLSEYVRTPKVNVLVTNTVASNYSEQIRVVGKGAANAQSIAFRDGMTLLDVMIEVGGLSEFAAGNRAKLIRVVDGQQSEIRIRIKDLMNSGKMSENIPVYPGDVINIPETRF